MKAHTGRNGVAQWVIDVAVAEGKRQADAQANAVAARAYNEMTISMHQAGLSTRTINRVHKILSEAVLQKVDGIRKTKKGESETQNMQDADCWMRRYCNDHGLTYILCDEKDGGNNAAD